MVLLSVLVLATATFIDARSFNARQSKDLDLFDSPSVQNKIKLYRAITNPKELAITRNRIGQHPTYLAWKEGDFNTVASGNLYFWDDEEMALDWCGDEVDENGEETIECAVATYEWDPPPGLRVRRWEKADESWTDFVTYNWKGSSAVMHPIQRNNDWIEGPMSMDLGDGIVPSAAWGMQHTVVNETVIGNLKIESVSSNINCPANHNKKRLAEQVFEKRSRPRRRSGCGTSDLAKALKKTTMFKNRDSGIMRKDPGLEPESKGICQGYKLGVIGLGPDVATGKEAYSIIDKSCKQVGGEKSENPCTGGTFSCSPPPIEFTQLHLRGQTYDCKSIPNAGRCPGVRVDVQYCCGKDK